MNAYRVFAVIVAASCSWMSAGATTIDLETDNSGWKASNTAFAQVGYSIGRHVGRAAPIVARSYFAFDLAGVNGTVIAAELLMFNGGLVTPDATETISLYDVTTPVAELVSTSATQTIFDDLGTGIVYGANSDFAPGASASTVRSFSLNGAALAAINAKLGDVFAMGAAMDSINPQGATSEITNSAVDFRYSTLRLTVVPEPAAALIAIPAVLALSRFRRLYT